MFKSYDELNFLQDEQGQGTGQQKVHRIDVEAFCTNQDQEEDG